MLNNAWPSLIWHLYDYFLQPAGGYFGAKKACEPLHVQYSYDDRSVVVVNSTYHDVSDLKVAAKLYDFTLQPRYSSEMRTNAAADGVARVLTLPEGAFNPRSPVYFLNLALEKDDGTTVSCNFYWLSAKKNVYEWVKTDYRFTPVSSYEDFTALQRLPKAGSMKVSADVGAGDEGPLVHVRVANPSNALAFQIHLGIHPPNGEMEILPVLWDDNYMELIPGESRDVTARFLSQDALENGAELVVTGWNVEATTVSLTPAKERRDATDGVH
jgi:exo-1,4-beta-D-glucosaminidase